MNITEQGKKPTISLTKHDAALLAAAEECMRHSYNIECWADDPIKLRWSAGCLTVASPYCRIVVGHVHSMTSIPMLLAKLLKKMVRAGAPPLIRIAILAILDGAQVGDKLYQHHISFIQKLSDNAQQWWINGKHYAIIRSDDIDRRIMEQNGLPGFETRIHAIGADGGPEPLELWIERSHRNFITFEDAAYRFKKTLDGLPDSTLALTSRSDVLNPAVHIRT